jgi:hypothetical protein
VPAIVTAVFHPVAGRTADLVDALRASPEAGAWIVVNHASLRRH